MDHIKVAKIPATVLQRAGVPPDTGTIHITPHHLLFIRDADNHETWLAYALIASVERRAPTARSTATAPTTLYPVIVRCRNFMHWVLLMPSENDAAAAFETMLKLGCNSSYERLLAFAYQPFPKFTTNDGWTVYDPRQEFARMGVGSRTDAWRLSTVNKDYTLCSTYPAVFAVPARISDIVLNYAAKYRSKGRIPALSYLHRISMASITRCSQPMVGLKQNRSIQDEKLIEAIFASNAPPGGTYGSTTAHLIVDARPTANALANVAKGAGSENMENYKNCKKVYLGIDNIHVMRESLSRMMEAVDSANFTGVLNRSQLAKSGWLKHIKALLEGTALIVKHVHVFSSHVVVHCSDGWDRTSQLVSLAEICLDPFYRTIRGLEVLIEKDWVSFGHKFGDRQGHVTGERLFLMNVTQGLLGEPPQSGGSMDDRLDDGFGATPPTSGGTATAFSSASAAAGAFADAVQQRFGGVRAAASGGLGNLGVSVGSGASGGPGSVTHGTAKETSPVFHQFLDAIYQIWTQFPTRFEYDERLLIALHTHSYSCQFGNFLFNTERERVEAGVASRTHSVWDYINSNMAEYRSPLYLPDEDTAAAGGDGGVILPSVTELRYWAGLLNRPDEELNEALQQSSSSTPATSNQSPARTAERAADGLNEELYQRDLPAIPSTTASASGNHCEPPLGASEENGLRIVEPVTTVGTEMTRQPTPLHSPVRFPPSGSSASSLSSSSAPAPPPPVGLSAETVLAPASSPRPRSPSSSSASSSSPTPHSPRPPASTYMRDHHRGDNPLAVAELAKDLPAMPGGSDGPLVGVVSESTGGGSATTTEFAMVDGNNATVRELPHPLYAGED